MIGSAATSSPTLAACSQISGSAGRGRLGLPRRSAETIGMLLAALEPVREDKTAERRCGCGQKSIGEEGERQPFGQGRCLLVMRR